jgi:hypothetical protein
MEKETGEELDGCTSRQVRTTLSPVFVNFYPLLIHIMSGVHKCCENLGRTLKF